MLVTSDLDVFVIYTLRYIEEIKGYKILQSFIYSKVYISFFLIYYLLSNLPEQSLQLIYYIQTFVFNFNNANVIYINQIMSQILVKKFCQYFDISTSNKQVTTLKL